MAKIRGIKPETWTDDKFVSVSPLARLLFIGMWNFACDNGHLDDSPRQLKMRVLPADSVDAAALLDELLEEGLVTRHDGYLKVPNLTVHQRLDARFLTLCDHCAHDEHTTFKEGDKKPRTTSARRAPDVRTPSAPGDGDGDGDGERKGRGSLELSKRARETRLPDEWKPSERHLEIGKERGVDVSEQAFRFRNHAHANDRRQRDWNAAFSNWLAKAGDFAPAKSNDASRAAGEWWR